VKPDDDVLIVLLPQNMVGASLFESLSAMADVCKETGAAMIVFNPNLDDRPSSGENYVSICLCLYLYLSIYPYNYGDGRRMHRDGRGAHRV